MRFAEAGIAFGVAASRIAALWAQGAPIPEWFADGPAVLALFWAALALAGPRPRLRNACLIVTCLWLAAIYVVYQGPHTFWLFRPGSQP
jgi:hypothetical protein